MKKLALIIFVIACVGEITSTRIEAEMLHLVCKPLIILSLIAYYFLSVPQSTRSKAVLGALVFSFAGDVLLMLKTDELYFKLGLAAFLIAQIFYILTYRQHKNEESENPLMGVQRVRFAFPIILSGTGLVVVLYPVLGDLRIPVMLYALVITIMVINALFRYGCTSNKSFWMVFMGAVLFMISDSILAMTTFIIHSNNDFWIMITYCIAQYFIVEGLIQHKPAVSNLR